jgi:addiction module RelB/DinJ family antitoxin
MKTMINIKVDKVTKDEAKSTAEELGIPLSTIMNAYLKQFVRTKEIHFYSSEGELKPSVRKRLDRLHEDVIQGKNLSPRFDRVEDAISYLHS